MKRLMNIPLRRYNEKVVNLFNNPKNIGKLDPKDPNVGSTMVGAPACFDGKTKVCLSDFTTKTFLELYEEGKNVEVMSFNLSSKQLEPKLAKCIKLEKQQMNAYKFSESDDIILCTSDHQFLTESLQYHKIQDIQEFKMGIIPSKFRKDKQSSCCGYKNDRFMYYHYVDYCRENIGYFDCYTLQVEVNNNYLVAITDNDDITRFLVSKNCGDVLRLDIKVENNVIKDAKCKIFGCGSIFASSDHAIDLIKGKTIDEASQISNKIISKEIGLTPVKQHCSMLAEEAIKGAIDNYKLKQKDLLKDKDQEKK